MREVTPIKKQIKEKYKLNLILEMLNEENRRITNENNKILEERKKLECSVDIV